MKKAKAFHEMTWAERLADAKQRHAASQYKTSLFVDERLLKKIWRAEIETALLCGQPVPHDVLEEIENSF